ncbi:hypothetical protein [Xylophilus sp.]|uniref:hypothetical protein n=1 Tax=Xylophilus sp. TaxID=2653893 RepID=UPI0013BD91D1|nr:hypothetical protein [Xylophilus sp.]KAF1048416.1 MAG: hypothetical protein GAK38_01428 [Xylophilus sp.]
MTSFAGRAAGLTILLAWAGIAAAQAPCPAADDVTQRELIGRWQATFADGRAPRILKLWQHPELAASVRGEVERGDAVAARAPSPRPVLLAGDVNHGEFTLEESADGTHISGTWIGQVTMPSCGKEITGTWTDEPDDPSRSPGFTLRKLEP